MGVNTKGFICDISYKELYAYLKTIDNALEHGIKLDKDYVEENYSGKIYIKFMDEDRAIYCIDEPTIRTYKSNPSTKYPSDLKFLPPSVKRYTWMSLDDYGVSRLLITIICNHFGGFYFASDNLDDWKKIEKGSKNKEIIKWIFQ